MTSSIQGIIIALLIAFLFGILVGYSLVQARLRKQAEALKVAQRRLEELEQSHELRLREATDQLRHSYEAELSETIEHYQDQLSQKTMEMEQIYETRFRVLQRGDFSVQSPSVTDSTNGTPLPTELSDQRTTSFRGNIEPLPEAKAPALSQPELLHLKKQYELRLKEAAQKLQKAYEKQLADHAKKTRADIQTEYERRLLKKFEEYEQQLADRRAELEAEYADRSPMTSVIAEDYEMPTPSQIMGTGDDTTVTLPPDATPGGMSSPATAAEYTQDEVDVLIQAATDQVRADCEQSLSQRLKEQQEQFELRLQELEAEYQQKTAALTASTASPESLAVDDWFGLNEDNEEQGDDDDDFGPLDLSDINQLT